MSNAQEVHTIQGIIEIRWAFRARVRLLGLPAQRRLNGLSVEERLEGLALNEVLAALAPKARVEFITDVDKGKTYHFRERGKKPAVFELGKSVRAKEYDPKLFKPGKAGPETLRRAVG